MAVKFCFALRRTVVLGLNNRFCSMSQDLTQDSSTTTLPFVVRRSHTNNLPVYQDYKNGRTRVVTIVRKIEGDIHVLEQMLRKHIAVPNLLTRVDELTGHIHIHGNYKTLTMSFLRSLGY